MTRKSRLLLAAALALCLALIVPGVLYRLQSRFTRILEADQFFLDMKPLNTTLTETFSLRAGDSVTVEISRLSGDVSLSIGQRDCPPIYEGRNPDLSSFQVAIPEDGEYLFTLTGAHAQGSVSLLMNRASAS